MKKYYNPREITTDDKINISPALVKLDYDIKKNNWLCRAVQADKGKVTK